MIDRDITYCICGGDPCVFTDCIRHKCNLDGYQGCVSLCDMSPVCDRYIKYKKSLEKKGKTNG